MSGTRRCKPELRPEFIELTLRLARLKDTHAGADGEFSAIDHEAFWRFLCHHRLANLAWQLRKPAVIPPSVWGQMCQQQQRQLVRQRQLWADLQRVTELLSKAGFEATVLKGFPLAWRLYHDLHARYLRDIDLLVRLEDLGAVLEQLTANGLCMHRGRRRLTRQKLRTAHAIALHDGSLTIDLHWRLRMAPAYQLDFAALWSSRQWQTVADQRFVTLSDEYQLTLLLLSFVHDIARGAAKIKHLLDIYLLSRELDGAIDWRDFFACRQSENVMPVIANGFALMFELFRCRESIPRLSHALAASNQALHVSSPQEARLLLERPKGNVENLLWFASIYPGSQWRGLLWLWDREFAHVGRIPLMVVRGARLTRGLIRFAWKQSRPAA